MLINAVECYLAVRRAAGFELVSEGCLLQSFARFSDAKGHCYVSSETAIEWAGLAREVRQQARRLGDVIRFARYMRPALTTISQPMLDIGRETVRLLLGVLQGTVTSPVSITLPHKLEIRSSTGAPPRPAAKT